VDWPGAAAAFVGHVLDRRLLEIAEDINASLRETPAGPSAHRPVHRPGATAKSGGFPPRFRSLPSFTELPDYPLSILRSSLSVRDDESDRLAARDSGSARVCRGSRPCDAARSTRSITTEACQPDDGRLACPLCDSR
jgi:hypothetical protein